MAGGGCTQSLALLSPWPLRRVEWSRWCQSAELVPPSRVRAAAALLLRRGCRGCGGIEQRAQVNMKDRRRDQHGVFGGERRRCPHDHRRRERGGCAKLWLAGPVCARSPGSRPASRLDTTAHRQLRPRRRARPAAPKHPPRPVTRSIVRPKKSSSDIESAVKTITAPPQPRLSGTSIGMPRARASRASPNKAGLS